MYKIKGFCKRKFLAVMVFFFLIMLTGYSQNCSIKCTLTNTLSEGCPEMSYIISNKAVKIMNCCNNKKIYYRKKVDKDIYKEMVDYINETKILYLDSIYNRNKIVVDAGSITLFISVNDLKKEIILNVCYQPKIDGLLRIINKFYPNKYLIQRPTDPCD